MSSRLYKGQEYSEGSELCQEGVLKVCENGAWRTIGRCPPFIDLSKIRLLRNGEDPFAESAGTEIAGHDAPSLSRVLTTRTIWAAFWGMTQTTDYLFCTAAPSLQWACTGERWQIYQIPILAVIEIAQDVQCPNLTRVCKVVYNTMNDLDWIY